MISISQEMLLILGGIIVSIIAAFGSVLVYLTRTLVQHRDFYNKREKWLISAIIAKDLPELGNYGTAALREPGDDLKQTELENDLAINAQKLMTRSQEEGIPIT
jgi:hypothetical protein